MDVYGTLCTEPWCFHPEQVNRLTDWQIWSLVIRPAVLRARQTRGGGQRPRGRKRPKSRLPTRDEYIQMGLRFGGTEDHWAAEYDRAMGGEPQGA